MYYIYTHTRLDTNRIFYVGLGSQKNYARAYTKSGRNRFWKRIVAKSGYSVQIIYDNLDHDTACEREVELIALHKLVNDGGTLCNATLGGEGILGYNHTIEAREKIRLAGIGRTQSLETKQKKRQAKLGKAFSERHRQNLSISHKGKPRTLESRERQKRTIWLKKQQQTYV